MYFHLPPRRTTAAIHRTTTTIGLDAYAKYVSIQVDDQDDPVIAFNSGNGMYFDMGIIYGHPDGSIMQATFCKIDQVIPRFC